MECVKQYEMVALSSRVLAVAVMNYDDGKLFDWAAYIDAVPGYDHDAEFTNVALHGSKLPDQLAFLLFPTYGTSYPEKYRS